MVVIPEAFAEATVLREGAAGRAWLHKLPLIAAKACHRWGCIADGDAWHGQGVGHPGTARTWRCCPQDLFSHAENRGEPDALRCFDGRGVVRLIDADDSSFVQLIERADPLTLADQLSKGSSSAVEEALEIAGDLARQTGRSGVAGHHVAG